VLSSVISGVLSAFRALGRLRVTVVTLGDLFRQLKIEIDLVPLPFGVLRFG
jgi:hypothetical protein